MGEMTAWDRAVPVEAEPWKSPHLKDTEELSLGEDLKYSKILNHLSTV